MSRRLVVLLAALAVGCGTASVVQTALHGDLASLKREIRQDQQQGKLDKGRVEDLAHAVAGRELRSATGPAALHRVQQLRACSGSLTAVLEDRASRPDDVGGAAALILLEQHHLDGGAALARYAESSSGAWRAVAARAATGAKDGELRRRFMADPDERVRRAALSAALDARDPFDLDTLLESARLDPDSLARSTATRAIGAIGGEHAVLALEDHWDRADDPTRMAIVDAWAMPASAKSGGTRELLALVERESSLPALAAADALIRLGAEGAAQGRAALARAITDGTQAEQSTAMQTAPIDDPDVRKALDKTMASPDPAVREMAAARLLQVAEARNKARRVLVELAKGKDSTALEARAALATAGEGQVRPALVGQLASHKPEERRQAALGLIQLGDWSHAATALADDDPSVRTATACSILSADDQR